MPATFAILFLVLMAVGVPIALALSLAPIIGFMLADKWTFLNIVPQKLLGGINQFPLLAIPLFILSGEVMNGSRSGGRGRGRCAASGPRPARPARGRIGRSSPGRGFGAGDSHPIRKPQATSSTYA